MMYFAVPLEILAVLFSRHAMFLLNTEYAGAWMAGVLLALGILLRVIMKFLQQVLMGTDDVDADKTHSASALLKSRLFLVGTVDNAYYVVYLAALAAFLYTFRTLPETELIVVWSSVMLAVSVPFLLYYIMLVRKHAPSGCRTGNILRHVVGGAGMAAVFVLTNEQVVAFETSIYAYLPGLLLELALCCAEDLGITYAFDYKTRKLFRLVLSEISRRSGAKG